jgi:diguanylate cyclase (GGDEF)-like protein
VTTAALPPLAFEETWDPARIDRVLTGARDCHWEDPVRGREVAIACQEQIRTFGDARLRARALAVLGFMAVNRGDLRGTYAVVAEAEREAESSGDVAVRAEVAALEAQLSFFAGSYTEALRYAGTALDLADSTGDPALRIFARRAACLVMGNLDAPGWVDELHLLIALSVEVGDRWQEAISRNDLGHWLMSRGDHAGAERELDRGTALARGLAPHNALCLAVLGCTTAELRMTMGRPDEALAEAVAAIELLTGFDEPHPYLFGMTTKLEVQALLALGRPDEAYRCGERALERLGDRVPQARSMILESVATALREAGRFEAAFDALARGAELERRALQELIELQVGFERATLETKAAREQADALALKHRELELAHTALEAAQVQLREQADRDALTGLHNRRYIAAEFARWADAEPDGPVSVAVIDLDHFKAINDRFGHAAGDQVLVRTAALMRANVRTTDILARTGGEEFVLLMPETDADAAHVVCERVLDGLRRETWQRIGDGLTTTASIGVASATGPAASIDLAALTAHADTLLYEAKRAGRDRVAAA